MKLQDVQLAGLGEFTDDACGFDVKEYNLKEPWSYIYSNRNMLLKVDQRGPDYIQVRPPSGTVLFKRERYQSWPSFFVWVVTGENRAFTNFWRPVVGGLPADVRPDAFRCSYMAGSADYLVEQDGIECKTNLFVPEEGCAAVMHCSVANRGNEARQLTLMPAMRPHMAAFSLEPWDIPALYQNVSYLPGEHHTFLIELRSPAGDPALREHAFLITDFPQADGVELSYERFTGAASFENPEAILRPLPPLPAEPCAGTQGVMALCRKLVLAAGESISFTMVTGFVEPGPSADISQVNDYAAYFAEEKRRSSESFCKAQTDRFASLRTVDTPDESFNRYVNEWLPLQLKWVGILDRGWPTGMRGTRDSAQDANALPPLDPGACRETLLNIFSTQRSDGWFLRQYSTQGRHGRHDTRPYVDGGVWVWELLYDYLCWTKDFKLLEAKAPFLDDDTEAPILEHAERLLSYYTRPENLGEHGLTLIRGGDWNDALNAAGLLGRGESVMVSCQAVLALTQASLLMDFLGRDGAALLQQGREMKANILKHALNEEGYLNGVFTDRGEWVFSPHDPDNRRRVSVPVNAFGIISGVLQGTDAGRALDVLQSMRGRDGWPLFHPAISDPPIEKLGRLGHGDLAPGLCENAAVYNHGSHGFLGRAAAAAGDGGMLLETLRYMLPYDQARHPVERTCTAPYGVVNYWKTAPGAEGRGGMLFLSGSISTAMRNIYDGLFGIQPALDGLVISPAVPPEWSKSEVEIPYLGRKLHIAFMRDRSATKITVTAGGREIGCTHESCITGREGVLVPDDVISGLSGDSLEVHIPEE